MRIDNPSISGSISFIAGTNSLSGTNVSLTGSFSGSFTGDGSLLSGVTSYTDDDTLAYINSRGVISGSAQIASDISGSFTDLSSSFELRITPLEISATALNAATSSYALEANISGAFASDSSSFEQRISPLEVSTTALNAATSSYALQSAISGAFASDSSSFEQRISPLEVSVGSLNAATSSYALEANISGAFTSVSQSIASDINLKLNISDTGSFAKTNIDNVFSGTQTFTNLTVSGTGSFAYINSVTGSAKIIGDSFIVVNNNTPAERYGGLSVYDSGSAGTTGSLFFDGELNDWNYEYTSLGGTDYGTVLFGPEYSTKGSPSYPTNTRLQKGSGTHHLADSNISDNGSKVSINSNTEVTGSLVVSSTITGTLSGNASTATTASFASTAPYSGLQGTVPTWNQNTTGNAATATSASHAGAAPYSGLYGTVPTWNQNTTGNAATATSASHAGSAPYSGLYGTIPTWNQNTTGNAATATSASYAATAPYSGLQGTVPTWNQDTTGNADTATSASHALYADSAGSATTATSASYAATGPFLSSYTETDTLASVTGRGATTSTALTVNNTLTISGANSPSSPVVNISTTGTGAYQRGVRMLNGGMTSGDSLMYAVGRADGSKNMGQFYFYYSGDGSNSNRISIGLHSVDDVFNILGSSNVQIGITTDQGYKFHVQGTLNASGAITQAGNQVWHAGNLTNLNQLTNGPGYISGESDTLATVTSRGNTSTGDINVNGNILLTGTATTTNQGRLIDFTGFDKEGTTDFSDRAYIQHTTNTGGHAGSVLVISSQNDADDGIAFLTNASSNLKHNSNVIWTAGNDGAGSGLDADTVDGIQAASFLRSDADDTTTGIITLAKGSTGTLMSRTGFSDAVGYNASYGMYIGGGASNATRYIYAGGYFYDGSAVRTLWHTGNDGAGSGLDADLWDGNQFSSYLNQAVLTSSSPSFSGVTASQLAATSTADATGLSFRSTSELISGEGWCTAHYAYNNNDGFLFLNRDAGTTARPTFHIGGYNNAGYAGFSDGDSMVTLVRNDGVKSTGSTYAGRGLSNSSYYTNIVKTTTGTVFRDAQGKHTFQSTVAGATALEVNGTTGQLFSVVDSLTGTIFAASDVSGIPILEVESGGVVTVNDTLRVLGDVTAYYSSDERLKKNIKPIESPLEKLSQISGNTFEWNEEVPILKHEGKDIGVIAQEIEKVLPEIVTTRPNGYKAVQYEKIVALLIESNKELLKLNNDLQQRIEKLESLIK